MRKEFIRDWACAVLPALLWLLFRYAGKKLPPGAECLLTGAALAAGTLYLLRQKGKAAFRLPWKACLLYAGMGIALGTVSRVCFGKTDGREASASGFLLLCFLGPAAEEILYRELVYERCLRFLPESGAVLVSSLLFAAAHETPVRMAAALAAGILLCFARKKAGTVTASVIMHAAVNLTVYCL